VASAGAQRDVLRARIVLRRAEGFREADVAAALGVSLPTVSLWSGRFELQGLEGLKDRPGRGRKSSLPARQGEGGNYACGAASQRQEEVEHAEYGGGSRGVARKRAPYLEK
jgi:hypothetical protein